MSAWGAPPTSGAWAAQVDEEEEENGGELDPLPPASAKAFQVPALGGAMDFPSLGETAASRETKKDRKKRQQKMSLGAFVAAGKKEQEVVDLPTAPRARADGDEEKREGLGGGFRNYGGDRGSFRDRMGGDRDDDRGFGRMDDDGPSRADAADDWGTKKTFVPSGPSRGGGFGDRERGGFGDRYTERRSGFGEGELNRADDADRWESKGLEPLARKSGGGFEERTSSFGTSNRADTEDRWSRRAPAPSDSAPESRWGGSGSLSTPSSGSRPRLNLKPRSAGPEPPAETAVATSETPAASEDKPEGVAPQEPAPRTVARSNPFGAAKPVAVKDVPELTRADSRRSQTSDADPPTPPPAAAPRARSNPFGAARPREEVLREKGIGIEAEFEGERRTSDLGGATPTDSGTEDKGSAAAGPETRAEPGTIDEASQVEEARGALENGLSLGSPPAPPPAAGQQKAAASSWARIASKAPEPAAEPEQET